MKKVFNVCMLIFLMILIVSCSNSIIKNSNEVKDINQTNVQAEDDVIIKIPTDDNYNLRKSIYNGNYKNIKSLYEKETDNDKKELLELSIYNAQELNDVFNKVFSENNKFQPQVFFSKKISECKYKDIIYKIADSRAGGSNLSDEFELISPNVDAKIFSEIVKEQQNDTYYGVFDDVYKLDIDNDGKDEYIAFFSYKQGDIWNIYEIVDGKPIVEADKVNDYNIHWFSMDIYKYQGMYLLVSQDYVIIYDDGITYNFDLDFIDKQSVIVFEDIYNDSVREDLTYTIFDLMNPSFEKYTSEVGQKIVASDEILKGFAGENDINETIYKLSTYGTIDFNNDSILDYTMSHWYADGNLNLSGEKSVTFLDGSTKEIIDLTSTNGENTSILTVTPRLINGKNYFLVQYATRYPVNNVNVFKLIEFIDNKPVVLRELLVTSYGCLQVSLD